MCAARAGGGQLPWHRGGQPKVRLLHGGYIGFQI